MLQPKPSGSSSRVGCQNIIYIIEAFIIGLQASAIYRKCKMVADCHIRCIIFNCRTLKITACTCIIAKLAVVIEIIFYRCSAFLTETSLSDLMGILIIHYLFTDSVSYIRITAFHCKVSRQCIIPVHDHLHLWCTLHHFF